MPNYYDPMGGYGDSQDYFAYLDPTMASKLHMAPQGSQAPTSNTGGLVNTSPAGGTPWNVDAAGIQYDQQGNPIGPTTPGAISGSYQPPDTGDEGTWGGPVQPFSGGDYPTFSPPPLPESLRNPYALPTAAELQATPGYMARYQQGFDARQRAAAARGTLLNGGTLKALDRYGQEYASGEYANAVDQGLRARNQAASEYLNLAYGPAWQSNQAALGKYQSLYGQYQDLIGNNRNAANDYWQQQKDLLTAGLNAAGAGNPGNPTT